MKVKDKDRKKWQEVLQIEYMSSEDSDGHENELKVRQLPWLSDNVTRFKEMLDNKRKNNMTSQSKRQTKRKVADGISQRPKPVGKAWMFKQET